MPTGYTAGVADGTVTDFTEYALQCARNFGACIMLRDEPLSGDIPEFTPSSHNETCLKEAERNLSEFLAMTEQQRHELHAAEQARNIAAAERGLAEKAEQRQRYEAMLAKARAFVSPSPDHSEYAKFIVSQLEESIQFDCETSYYDELKEPVAFDAWKAKRIADLRRDIWFRAKHHQEELERTALRNRWVRQLKDALGVVH